MSIFNRNPAEETWYVHAPLKNDKRPAVLAPAPSNIPYLNGTFDDETDIKQRTIWFRGTDSKHTQLSKLGGHAGKSQFEHSNL
jgi:hypothetical protein